MLLGSRRRTRGSSSFIPNWENRPYSRDSDSSTPPAPNPDLEGDNYQFVDVDSPNGDYRFALNDKAGGALNYVLTVVGAAGMEQINMAAGFDWPTGAAFDLDTPGYQFTLDGYFRLINETTGVHYHTISGYDLLQADIGGREPSNPALIFLNPGMNYKFVTSPTVSFYLKDLVSGLWVKPWIVLSGGIPMIQLDPT